MAHRANLLLKLRVSIPPEGQEPLIGGSGPGYLFTEVLGAPVVTLPLANFDNNQHAANENLRLGNLWDGIEMYADLLARLGKEWSVRVVPF